MNELYNTNSGNVKLTTIKQQVYLILKDKIINGEIKTGERLYEKEIAESMGVSRSPVRESLNELIGEGLLHNIPNKGVFVKRMDKKDIYDIYEYRMIMEKYAIKKAIKNLSNDDIIVLNSIYNELQKRHEEDDKIGYHKVDIELHDTIFIISRNEIMYKSIRSISDSLQPLRTIALNNAEGFKRSLNDHQGIIKGILERDFNKAWGYDKSHLINAQDTIIEHLNSLDF